jgi:hypothetical protein
MCSKCDMCSKMDNICAQRCDIRCSKMWYMCSKMDNICVQRCGICAQRWITYVFKDVVYVLKDG